MNEQRDKGIERHHHQHHHLRDTGQSMQEQVGTFRHRHTDTTDRQHSQTINNPGDLSNHVRHTSHDRHFLMPSNLRQNSTYQYGRSSKHIYPIKVMASRRGCTSIGASRDYYRLMQTTAEYCRGSYRLLQITIEINVDYCRDDCVDQIEITVKIHADYCRS